MIPLLQNLKHNNNWGFVYLKFKDVLSIEVSILQI